MTIVSNIVPQLGKLKDLSLHETVAKTYPKLAAKIWEDLHYQPSPVYLYFTNDHVYQGCPFAPVVMVVLVEATPSEDSNIEESDSDIGEMANSDSDDSI